MSSPATTLFLRFASAGFTGGGIRTSARLAGINPRFTSGINKKWPHLSQVFTCPSLSFSRKK
jgi:hypothetical protein